LLPDRRRILLDAEIEDAVEPIADNLATARFHPLLILVVDYKASEVASRVRNSSGREYLEGCGCRIEGSLVLVLKLSQFDRRLCGARTRRSPERLRSAASLLRTNRGSDGVDTAQAAQSVP